jgi:hypothetical protein
MSFGVVISDASGTQVLNNVIANNFTGVTIVTGGGNRISQNSIFANTLLGISLVTDSMSALSVRSRVNRRSTSLEGPSPNDNLDVDTGGNGVQNYPELVVTQPSNGTVVVTGTLMSSANQVFTIEFFKNTETDASGFGEGRSFLGFTSVTTDAQGRGSFSKTFSVALLPTESVSATAIEEPSGNTSEFSVSTFESPIFKPGGKLNTPPAVAVENDDITVTVQALKPPKAKKTRSLSRLEALELMAAASKGKVTVQYRVSVSAGGKKGTQRKTSKRNIIAFNNLKPGNYTATYMAQAVQGGKVIAKTKESPATAFTIGS